MNHDPRVDYDRLREQGLTKTGASWVACRHADVVAIAQDPQRFSSGVSRFLQVPNGLDGDAHARMRGLFDPFFSPSRMAALAGLRWVATDLVAELPRGEVIDAVTDYGSRFAVRFMTQWLGWPTDLEDELLAWMAANHEASRSGDLARTAEVAGRFDDIIRRIVTPRLLNPAASPADVTDEVIALLRGEHGFEEILVSVLRNWTGGDLGSIALCVGVLVHWLASHHEHLTEFRNLPDEALDRAIDEVLRIDDPFVSNRRVATVDAPVGGILIPAGDRVVLNWTGANRDPAVFGDPERFDPEANAAGNLVYGTGPHVCPGRPLATLELRIAVQELLRGVQRIDLVPGDEPVRAQPPVGGFESVPVVLA